MSNKKSKTTHPKSISCICIVGEDKFQVTLAREALNNLPSGALGEDGTAHMEIEFDFRNHRAWNVGGQQTFSKESSISKFQSKYGI